jgi:hypothetical protein
VIYRLQWSLVETSVQSPPRFPLSVRERALASGSARGRHSTAGFAAAAQFYQPPIDGDIVVSSLVVWSDFNFRYDGPRTGDVPPAERRRPTSACISHRRAVAAQRNYTRECVAELAAAATSILPVLGCDCRADLSMTHFRWYILPRM